MGGNGFAIAVMVLGFLIAFMFPIYLLSALFGLM